MPSGLRCQSPAMRGSAFCYHHGRRIPAARKAPSAERRIEIPATLDPNGTSHAAGNILQALANGHISARRASVLLYALRLATGAPSHSACPPPAAVDSFPGGLCLPADICDPETISMVNALAQKLGLGSPDASPPESGPKASRPLPWE